MSKYETGDKFIITIGEVFGNEPVSIYKAEGTNTLYLNDAQLDKLEKMERNNEKRGFTAKVSETSGAEIRLTDSQKCG